MKGNWSIYRNATVGLLLFLFYVASGCGRTSVVVDWEDGGGGPTEDGFDGHEGAYDDGDPRIDLDLGDDFWLLVPKGTMVCGTTLYAGIFDIYRTRTRISLNEGTYRLHKDQASFSLELIQKLEFGPDKEELVPYGPGAFTRQIEGTNRDGFYRYEYRQLFNLNGEPYELVYQIRFLVENGIAVNPLMVFDEEYVSRVEGYSFFDMVGNFSPGGSQRYTTCKGDLYRRIHHEVSLANGDLFRIEQRMHRIEDGNACMERCPATIVWAVFQSGSEAREVSDAFRLAYLDGQHNWWQEFLVVFDQPVSSVYGVYMKEEEIGKRALSVQYLDVNLQTTEEISISDYKIAEE